MPSSAASSTCRTDWRPSRWLVLALAALGPGAAAAVALSDLPPAVAAVLAPILVARGGWLAVREARRPPACIEGGRRATRVDGVPATAARWTLRGPFAWLRVRLDGRWRHFAWAPDTLPPAERRRLHLALGREGATAGPSPMAP